MAQPRGKPPDFSTQPRGWGRVTTARWGPWGRCSGGRCGEVEEPWWFGQLEGVQADLDAFIGVGVDHGDKSYGCALNPDIDPEREFDALGWCAQLITRIEDLGFDQAMMMDSWRWQLWVRAVDLPPLG